jgi:hypothetical protein
VLLVLWWCVCCACRPHGLLAAHCRALAKAARIPPTAPSRLCCSSGAFDLFVGNAFALVCVRPRFVHLPAASNINSYNASCIIFDDVLACTPLGERCFELFCGERVHTFRAESNAVMRR